MKAAITPFSYRRWSSPKSTHGDSERRQTEMASRICKEKGWHLVDLPPEKATSAFRGKNLDHRAVLGQFLQKAENGELPKPCILILEKLDRFSRTDVDLVLPLFMQLLKNNVEVYSVIEQEHYTKEKLKSDPALTIIKMLMAFVGANAYSRALSERVSSVLNYRLSEAQQGKPIMLGGIVPKYFKSTGTKKQPYAPYIINARGEVVKRIFKEYSTGLTSIRRICIALNKDKEPTFHHAKHWSPQTVKSILKARHVLGEFKGVKDFYPKLIDETTYNKVQSLLMQHAGRRGHYSDRINLFKGFIYCSACQQRIVITSHDNRYYYRCHGRYTGICEHSSTYRADELESELFCLIFETDPATLIGEHNVKVDKEVKAIQLQLNNNALAISRLTSLLNDPKLKMDSLKKDLLKLKQEQDKLNEQLERKQISLYSALDIPKRKQELDDLFKRKGLMAQDAFFRSIPEILKKETLRKQLVLILPALIKRIDVDLYGHGFKVTFHSGQTKEVEPIYDSSIQKQ